MTRRICSRHYGIVLSRPFNPDFEVRDRRVYYNHFYDKEYRDGWMQWQIKKVPRFIATVLKVQTYRVWQGAKLRVGEKKSLYFSQTHEAGDEKTNTLELFSSSLENPPERDDDPTARKLV